MSMMTEDDAMEYVIEHIKHNMDKAPDQSTGDNKGFDVFIPDVMEQYIITTHKINTDRQDIPSDLKVEYFPIFQTVAWELCRRGILRMFRKSCDAHIYERESWEGGFSLTEHGRTWLRNHEQADYVPLEPGRFSQIIGQYAELFGPGFQSRAQEAARCFKWDCFLACCVMCGAAAESILLRIAIEKKRDEGFVLSKYQRAQGRRNIKNLVIQNTNRHIQKEFPKMLDQLSEWRDVSSHGQATQVSDNESFVALRELIRFASFCKDNWTDLTTSPNNRDNR